MMNRVILIAEAGPNHNGKLKFGKRLIDEAKKAGADIIKFQTYKAKKLTTKNAPRFWNWKGELKIGKYCLITPGVRIMAAESIEIGDACMFAHGAYISDADWHGIYDRSEPVGNTKPIILEDNVWIGDSAIVCKGVTIGENSIIGAGAVVTKNIPANVVAAGNPAKVVKNLDQEDFISRKDFYKDPIQLAKDFDNLDKFNLKDNTFIGWLRSIFAPSKNN